jgi:glycosyltransferase involved in cell wall biosynthesis
MVDGPGATWRISFERPLRAARARGEVGLCCFDENALQRFSIEQIRSELTSLIEAAEPAVVVLSRCSSVAVQFLLEVAERADVPCIYHIDDDLFGVSRQLGASKFNYYNSPERRANLRIGCTEAELIYCSTRSLYDRLGRFGFATPMVYGEIYCAAPDAMHAFAPKRPLTIGYMGSSGHDSDLALIVPEIVTLMRERSEVNFEVFGTVDMPLELSSDFPGRTSKFTVIWDYDEFLQRLGELGWAVGLAPLRDIAFNTVKANTKFIEYTAAGIPSVVSSGRVYGDAIRRGVASAASSSAEWRQAICSLLDDLGKARTQAESAQAYIRAEFSEDRLAQQVLRVMRAVINRRARSCAATQS